MGVVLANTLMYLLRNITWYNEISESGETLVEVIKRRKVGFPYSLLIYTSIGRQYLNSRFRRRFYRVKVFFGFLIFVFLLAFYLFVRHSDFGVYFDITL